MRLRTSGLALAAAGALTALAGCSSSSSPHTSLTPTPSASSASPTDTAPASPSNSPTPTSTPTQAAKPQRCRAADLVLTFKSVRTDNVTGRIGTFRFAYRSVGAGCTLTGYSKVRLYDAQHREMTVFTSDTSPPAPQQVTVNAGAPALEDLGWIGAGCIQPPESPSYVGLVLPSGSVLVVSARAEQGEQMQVCKQRVTVHAYRAG